MTDTRGMCLAELAIGMAIAILVLAGLFEVLNLGQSAIGEKQRIMAQQQDVRVGLEVFEQEARLATAESFISANHDTVEFLANVHALHTNTTSSIIPGQSAIPVVDGSGWGKGKTVVICKPLRCETHRLSRTGQRSQLMLEDEIREVFPTGASVEISNRVAYYTKPNEQGHMNLMRMVDGGANVLIAELETVRFSYRDEKGRLTSVPSKVACIIVDIEPRYTRKREAHSVALRS